MLKTVTPIGFIGELRSGKTKPLLLRCQDADKQEIDLYVKFSAGCDRKENSLCAEIIAAMLAVDLGLPIPETFFVESSPEFTASIPDPTIRQRIQNSHRLAFGSKKLPSGYSILPSNFSISTHNLPIAADILAFDILIDNPDRRVIKPNCLTNGKELAIIDHEMALTFSDFLWIDPWKPNGIDLRRRATSEHRHIFYDKFRGTTPNWQRLQDTLKAIAPDRLKHYGRALPDEWPGSHVQAKRILDHIQGLQANAGAVFSNLLRALQ
jgi:hypothetical protein